MSEEPSQPQPDRDARAQAWISYLLGVLVFLLGIGLLLVAFSWGYQVLQGVDAQISRVERSQPVANPAADRPAEPAKTPEVVTVKPPEEEGPKLTGVLAAGLLKLLCLLVLAAIGGMMAGRGAQMAGVGSRRG